MKEIFGTDEANFLNLGNVCNNNCWFCTNKGKDKRFKESKEIDKETEHLDKCRKLVLYSEPTIHPNFLEIIPLLKERGFDDINILTNGRMLSNLEFCKKVSSLGIASFIIKVNGHTEHIHDPLARVKGSFNQTIKGIKNLISLGAEVSAQITVTEQNFVFIPKTIKIINNKILTL